MKRLDPATVYYLDECGVAHGLYREWGRAPRGQRLTQQVSGRRQHGRTGIIGVWQAGRLVASMVFAGSCNAAVVNTFFAKVLLPVLPAGVVLDNASFHHASAAGALARDHGVGLLYLPAYSPDLNPIEHFWATLKRALRATLPTARHPRRAIQRMCQCYY